MTDTQNTQQTEIWTLTAIVSLVAGVGSIILALNLRYMDIGWAWFAAVAAIILALASAHQFRKAERPTSWFGSFGSISGALAIVILVAGELIRNN